MKESPSLYQLGALLSQNLTPQDVPADTWPETIQLALSQGLAPMLLWTIKQNAPDIVTEPLWSPIISAVRATGVRYVMLEKTQKQVSAALSEAQIPALWLKGISLAHMVYPQPVLRPMGDLDVLVPYEQRARALCVVEGLGYHFYETDGQLMSSAEALQRNLTHHYHLKGGMSNSIILELHFRLLGTDNNLLPLDRLGWFWTQTTLAQNGSQFTALQPEAHLLYMSAHAILQHGEANTSLRQYFDLYQLIQQRSINWDKVIEQAFTLDWSYAVSRALTLTVRYFSAPVPDTILAQLQIKSANDANAVRAMRLHGRGSYWEHMLINLQELSFADRVDIVSRVLAPPRSYIRVRYNLRSNQRVWPYYLYRWFDQSREIAWAMWSRMTRRLGE